MKIQSGRFYYCGAIYWQKCSCGGECDGKCHLPAFFIAGGINLALGIGCYISGRWKKKKYIF